MPDLHVQSFGPADGPLVLAVHGLTGHGRRWAALARDHLADVRIVAPDLRGHGRSPATPPWGFEAHVADLTAVLERVGAAVVVGHSFGGAVALHLASERPDLVRSLVLLDPAIGLDPARLLTVAEQTLASPDYTNAAEARADKANGSWGEVAPELLDEELAEHLVPWPHGRVGWRINLSAVTACWGELAREFVLPPPGMRTSLVQAMKVQPPYVTPEFREALAAARVTVAEWDCDHMVPQARPAEVAALIRTHL
ncbi:MAG TPA: alpha/beta fold hydrolase [Aldersonia sp.]